MPEAQTNDPHLDLALPSSGYLAEYIRYCTTVTMAPAEFHLACGLAQMGAMLGNKVAFTLGAKLYPAHVWMVLLGPAGSKKSTAIGLATGILDEATGSTLRFPHETSREKMLELLAERNVGYLEQSEFTAFLGRSSRDYNAGFKEDLCEIWDSPSHPVTKSLKSGSTTIKPYPAVTILGGTVTQALGEWVRHRDLEGGFLSRFMFVPRSSPIVYQSMRDPDTPERHTLAVIARSLYEGIPVNGKVNRITFSNDSLERWEEYDREMVAMDVPPELSGFQGRLGVYAAKLSLCYALAGTGHPSPSAEHVDLAVAFVEYTRRHVWSLLDDLDPSRTAQDRRKVLNAISRLGKSGEWIRVRDIQKRCHNLKRKELEGVLDTLEFEETIERQNHSDGGRPRQEVRIKK